MQTKPKRTKTPSRIMAGMIEQALRVTGTKKSELAAAVKCSPNTVTNDLRDPERIPQGRMWLYFTALDIPVETVLQNVAYSIADKMIHR